jgi:hypothetical protein
MLGKMRFGLFPAAAVTIALGLAQPSNARDARFTIAVIPDTQNYVDFQHQKADGFPFGAKPMFIEQMRFIAQHLESAGGEIAFVTGLGDIWQHQSLDMDPGHAARGYTFHKFSGQYAKDFGPQPKTRSVEMPAAAEGYDLIAGKVPFSVVPGNHDFDAMWVPPPPAGGWDKTKQITAHVGGTSNFTSVFGSRSHYFRGKPWYVASHDQGADSAQIFTAGGYRFLHIGLQFDPPDASLAWAATVLDRYRGLPTILSTHDFMNRRKQRIASPEIDNHALDPQDNNPEMVWQKLVVTHPQIFMVLAGHQGGQATRIDRNKAGGEVYQLLSDYQDRGQVLKEAGLTLGPMLGMGDGWMRLMAFDMAAKVPTVHVRTYSTHYKAFSNELPSYAAWYKAAEKPELSDQAFNAEDDFTLTLTDFRARFDRRARVADDRPGRLGGSARPRPASRHSR